MVNLFGSRVKLLSDLSVFKLRLNKKEQIICSIYCENQWMLLFRLSCLNNMKSKKKQHLLSFLVCFSQPKTSSFLDEKIASENLSSLLSIA